MSTRWEQPSTVRILAVPKQLAQLPRLLRLNAAEGAAFLPHSYLLFRTLRKINKL